MTAIVAALIVTTAVLGLDTWLARHDRAVDVLTPEPERVVQTFVSGLAARRPESAATQLVEHADGEAPAARLRAFDAELRARHGDYRFAQASASRDGETADVRAELRAAGGDTVERRFRLTRDPRTRLWKIAAFDLPAS